MADEYSEIIAEVGLKVLSQYGEQGPEIWEIIKDEVIADTLYYMAGHNKKSLDRDSLALIIGKIIFARLSAMTPNQYQKLAMKTCSLIDRKDNSIPMLNNAMLGLCGEAGECADIVKKHLYQGHDLDKEHIAKELGDVAWYLAEAAEAIGCDLNYILQMNIDKLRARYPDGHFDAERSLNRVEDDI